MKNDREKLAHIEELLEIGSSGLDELIGYLDDSDESIRLAAIEALGDLEDELATEPLMKQYRVEDSVEMKNAVILAICCLEDERSYSLIQSIIADPSTNDEVLYACYLALTGMNKTLDVSIVAMGKVDDRFRRLAQQALDTLD